MKFFDQDGLVASGFLINSSSLCFLIYAFIHLSQAICSHSFCVGVYFYSFSVLDLRLRKLLSLVVHIPFLQYCTVQGFLLIHFRFILYFIFRLLEGLIELSGLGESERVVINYSEGLLLYNHGCVSHGRLVNAAFIFSHIDPHTPNLLSPIM